MANRRPVWNPVMKRPTYCINIVISPKSSPAHSATPTNKKKLLIHRVNLIIKIKICCLKVTYQHCHKEALDILASKSGKQSQNQM